MVGFSHQNSHNGQIASQDLPPESRVQARWGTQRSRLPSTLSLSSVCLVGGDRDGVRVGFCGEDVWLGEGVLSGAFWLVHMADSTNSLLICKCNDCSYLLLRFRVMVSELWVCGFKVYVYLCTEFLALENNLSLSLTHTRLERQYRHSKIYKQKQPQIFFKHYTFISRCTHTDAHACIH